MDDERFRRNNSSTSREYRSKALLLLLLYTTIRQEDSPRRPATAGPRLLRVRVPHLTYGALPRLFLSAKPDGYRANLGWRLPHLRVRILRCRRSTQSTNLRRRRDGDSPSSLQFQRMIHIPLRAVPARLQPLSASLDPSPDPDRSR